MNTLNSKTNESNKFMYQFTDKLNLENNLSIYYTWKNIKSQYNNNKLKKSAATINDEFNLPDGSYFVSDIQDFLNTSSKNMKLLQIISLYRFVLIR